MSSFTQLIPDPPMQMTDKATQETIALVTTAMVMRPTSIEEIIDVVSQIFPNLEFQKNGDDTLAWRHRVEGSRS